MGNWGTIAERYDEYGHFCVAGHSPTHGVRCATRSGVVYQGPPHASTGLRGWVKVPNERLRYVLPLGDSPIEPEHQSLDELAASLRDRARDATEGRGDLPEGDPELDRLDKAVIRLVEIARVLSKEESWLGRVHPENVMLIEQRPGPPDRELILTEWGFAFNSHVASGDPPDWVANSPWSLLWDREPAEMNEWLLKGGRPEEKGVDRRTLVRLIACLLVGRDVVESWCRAAPRGVGGGSRLVALPRDEGLASPLWTGLNDVLEGRTGSLEKLAALLDDHPPSRHFIDTIAGGRATAAAAQERDRRKWRRRALIAGVGAPLLAAGLAGGVVLLIRSGCFDPPKPAHVLCPGCVGGGPLDAGLDRLVAARSEGADQHLAALKNLYALATRAGRKPIPAELDCLEAQRQKFLDGLGEELERISKRLVGLPGDSSAECSDLNAVWNRAMAAIDLDPEKSRPDWLSSLKEKRKWHCGLSEP